MAWDSNPEGDIANYIVRYGSATGVYVKRVDAGAATSVGLVDLQEGTYFCAVSAVNASGLESLPSEELTFQITADAPPSNDLFDGQSMNVQGQVTLDVSRFLSGIVRTEIYADEQLIGATEQGATSITWADADPGEYSIVVKGYSDDGEEVYSEPMQVSLVKPGITSLSHSPEAGFHMTVTGAPGRNQSVYFSGDLQEWHLLTTQQNESGTMVIVDEDASSETQRFYKVVSE